MEKRAGQTDPPIERQPAFGQALRQLYHFMPPPRRRQFYGLLAFMLLGALAEIASIGAVVPFISLLAQPGQVQQFPVFAEVFAVIGAGTPDQQLVAATILFMTAAIFAALIRLRLTWSTQSFVLQLGHDMSVEIQRRILFQPYAFHISRNSSEIIASLEKVQVLASGVLLRLMQAATAAFLGLFIIAVLVKIDPAATGAAAIAFGALYALVSLMTYRRLAENSATLGSAYEQRIQIIQESLGGIRDVIIDHSQQAHLSAFREVDRRFTWAQATTFFISAAPGFVIEAAGMVAIAAIAVLLTGREGGLAVALPTLGALALGAQRLLPLMQQLYHGWTYLSGHRAIAGQVMELLRLPIDPERTGAESGPRLPFRREIRLEAVSFTYPQRSRPALEDVDLVIPHGSRIALIGKTGSGKTTLADLLMGLLEPDSGQICVDDAPLAHSNYRAWQRCIAHVPQTIFLADASIADNIALGRPAELVDMDRVRAATRLAQLEDEVLSLPDGYDSRVGERGVRLSGGQRQRLGLARAIYKDAPLLVLDEATSALDGPTEASVMQALNQLGRERTIVIIAHRASTVLQCELIARLEKGRLVDFGPAAEVLSRQP